MVSVAVNRADTVLATGDAAGRLVLWRRQGRVDAEAIAADEAPVGGDGPIPCAGTGSEHPALLVKYAHARVLERSPQTPYSVDTTRNMVSTPKAHKTPRTQQRRVSTFEETKRTSRSQA